MHSISNDCKADNGETFQFSYSDGSYGFTAEGEFHPFSSGGGTDTSDATAYAKNIEYGYTAYARGEKIIGTLIVPNENIKTISGSSLQQARQYLAAAQGVGYAIFGGGYSDNVATITSNKVDAFSTSLSRSIAPTLTYSRAKHIAVTNGQHVIFSGGLDDNGYRIGYSEAYDMNLTKTSSLYVQAPLNSAATETPFNSNNEKSALIGGGGIGGGDSDTYLDTMWRIYSDLTVISSARLSKKRNQLAASFNNSYAIFAGGSEYQNKYSNVVDAYSKSGTRSIPTPLSVGRFQLVGTYMNNYVLFAGGIKSGYSYDNTVDTYDIYLTKGVATPLSYYGDLMTNNIRSDYTLIGCAYLNKAMDAYDNSLTRTMARALCSSARYHSAGTRIGNYALFAGGYGSGALSTNSNAYYVG